MIFFPEGPAKFFACAKVRIGKDHKLVQVLKEWVDGEYANGRVTVMYDEELTKKIDEVSKLIGIEVTDGAIKELSK